MGGFGPDNDPRIRPSRAWYGAAAGLFALCILGGVGWLVWTIALYSHGAEQFLTPGTHTLDVRAHARYQVWNDVETVFQGRAYQCESGLPESLRLQVVDLSSGRELPFMPAWGLRESDESTSRCAVGAFEAPADGKVEIRVTGFFPSRVFSVRYSQSDRLLYAFIGGGALIVIGWLAPMVLVYLVYVRRAQARRELYGPDY